MKKFILFVFVASFIGLIIVHIVNIAQISDAIESLREALGKIDEQLDSAYASLWFHVFAMIFEFCTFVIVCWLIYTVNYDSDQVGSKMANLERENKQQLHKINKRITEIEQRKS